MDPAQSTSVPLLPPPPESEAEINAPKVEVGSEGIKFDALGPLVVNSDGVCFVTRTSGVSSMFD